MKFGRVGVGILAVFGVIAAGCGSDSDPGSDASVSVPDVVIENVAVESSSALMDLGWVVGDSGLLEPPPIEYVEGYAPEDQAAYFTFENNSGYNLDLTVVVTTDNGDDQAQTELNKGARVEFATPLGDDASFGFVLTQPGQSTIYSFAGDRGGAPCQDTLSEIGPGSSWTVEFVPTDGGTFGFPGTMTSEDGVECTFGMLTSFQSALTEHPVLIGIGVAIFAAAVVVTGFKIAKARRVRAIAKDGEVIAATARTQRLAPEIAALTREEVELQQQMFADVRAVIADTENRIIEGVQEAAEARQRLIKNFGQAHMEALDPVTGTTRWIEKTEYEQLGRYFRVGEDSGTGEKFWERQVGANWARYDSRGQSFSGPFVKDADLPWNVPELTYAEIAAQDTEVIASTLFTEIQGTFEELTGVDSRVLWDFVARRAHQRALLYKEAGLGEAAVAEASLLDAEAFSEGLTAYVSQARIPRIAQRYAAADGAVYERVMATIGDQVTVRALEDASFGVAEWEEVYLAAREELAGAEAVGAG